MPNATEIVRQCEMAFQSAPRLRKVAVVAEEDAFDIACLAPGELAAVIRCVDQFRPKDAFAIATMISEGDFIWGAVVYEQGEPPNSPGLIESFHVSQLDQLVARLIELREACGEVG